MSVRGGVGILHVRVEHVRQTFVNLRHEMPVGVERGPDGGPRRRRGGPPRRPLCAPFRALGAPWRRGRPETGGRHWPLT